MILSFGFTQYNIVSLLPFGFLLPLGLIETSPSSPAPKIGIKDAAMPKPIAATTKGITTGDATLLTAAVELIAKIACAVAKAKVLIRCKLLAAIWRFCICSFLFCRFSNIWRSCSTRSVFTFFSNSSASILFCIASLSLSILANFSLTICCANSLPNSKASFIAPTTFSFAASPISSPKILSTKKPVGSSKAAVASFTDLFKSSILDTLISTSACVVLPAISFSFFCSSVIWSSNACTSLLSNGNGV